jgi:hypothetical protein
LEASTGAISRPKGETCGGRVVAVSLAHPDYNFAHDRNPLRDLGPHPLHDEFKLPRPSFAMVCLELAA